MTDGEGAPQAAASAPQLAEGYQYYRQQASLNATYAKGWYNQGTELLRRGEHAKAAEAFRAALEIKPDHADAWLCLGIALLSKKDALYAITALTNALQYAPESADGWYLLGRAYYEHGLIAQTMECYKRASAIDSTLLPYDLYDDVAAPWFASDLKRKVYAFLAGSEVYADELGGESYLTVPTGDLPQRQLLGILKLLGRQGKVATLQVAAVRLCSCYGEVAPRWRCPACGGEASQPGEQGYSYCPACQGYVIALAGAVCLTCRRSYESIESCQEKITYRYALSPAGMAAWAQYTGQVKTGVALAALGAAAGVAATWYVSARFGTMMPFLPAALLLTLAGLGYVAVGLYRLQVLQAARARAAAAAKASARAVLDAVGPRVRALSARLKEARRRYLPTAAERQASEEAGVEHMLEAQERRSALGARVMRALEAVARPFERVAARIAALRPRPAEEAKDEEEAPEAEETALDRAMRRALVAVSRVLRPLTQAAARLTRKRTAEELEEERMRRAMTEEKEGPSLLKSVSALLARAFSPLDRLIARLHSLLGRGAGKSAEEEQAEAEMLQAEEEESGIVASLRSALSSLARSLRPIRDAVYRTFRRKSEEERMKGELAKYHEDGTAAGPARKGVGSRVADALGKLLRPVDLLASKLSALTSRKPAVQDEEEGEVDVFFKDKVE